MWDEYWRVGKIFLQNLKWGLPPFPGWTIYDPKLPLNIKMRTFSYQENVPEEFFCKLAMFYTFRQVVRMSYDPRGSKSTGRDVNIARNGLSFAKNIATKYLFRPVIGDAQEINFLQSFQLSQLGKKNVVNVFTIQCASPSQQKNSQLFLTNY